MPRGGRYRGRADADSRRKSDTFAAWKQALETRQGLPNELESLISRRELEVNLLVEIVRGMEMDIEPPRYASYEDLQAYCWRAAGAVGLVSAKIFGCRRPESDRYAEELGYALQLTNILRDVAGDARLGRITFQPMTCSATAYPKAACCRTSDRRFPRPDGP